MRAASNMRPGGPAAAYPGRMTPAVEVADHLYERWNTDGLSVLSDRVDPEVELICDPLRPAESALHGLDGWQEWVARWERHYEAVHITVDGLVPRRRRARPRVRLDHATPPGARTPLHWAAAHLWTLRDGRIAGWEPHLDLAAARRTLDASAPQPSRNSSLSASEKPGSCGDVELLVALELERDVEDRRVRPRAAEDEHGRARMSTSQSSGSPCCS